MILAVDPGKAGGAAVWSCGMLLWSSPVTDDHDKCTAVMFAYDAAKRNDLPLIVLFETWRPPVKGSDFGWMAGRSLAASKGGWKAIVSLFEPFTIERRKYPKMLDVYSQTWQAAVLKCGNAKSARRIELTIERGNQLGHPPCIDDNEAASRCIGEWGTRSGKVGELLPKSFRRAA